MRLILIGSVKKITLLNDFYILWSFHICLGICWEDNCRKMVESISYLMAIFINYSTEKYR
jgi:hypothetical protein